MHLVLCQPDIDWENPAGTRDRIEALLGPQTLPAGGLIVLPEMATTGFSMNTEITVEAPEGPTERFYRDLARRHRSCVLGGVVTHWHGAPRNQAIAIAPDGTMLARYTKQQPFSLAGEADAYPAGQDPVVFDWGGFRIAPFICYDLRFPELFRAATAQGATLLAVIANWPAPRHHHWTTLLAARAIENQAVVIGVNRAGHDPFHGYSGGSQVLDCQGRRIAEAGDQPQILTAEIDPQTVADWRATFPALRDAGLASE